MSYWVYILASDRNGTFYVGVTNDLSRRAFEHRNEGGSAFTKKYRVHKLVYAESHEDIYEAIAQEKRIKRWRRLWKLQLIERDNPEWHDLFDRLNS